MEVQRLIHAGWKEWDEMPISFKKKSMFGVGGWAKKYQYIYSSSKKRISLVRLKVGGLKRVFWMWEIMEIINNKPHGEVERFRTKKQAIKRIKEILK